MKADTNDSKVIIYESDDGSLKIQVMLENETVWLSQQQLANLYQTSRTNIVEHIRNIYKEKELAKEATCRNFRQVRNEGKRQVKREIPFYNLNLIISLGYRVRSKTATRFRQWATQRLKEYVVKGFTMDDERLKNLGGGNYWKELLDRIRDIRSSEKVLYRQVLDLYATSTDYAPNSKESIRFFKVVQNKLHYAAHGKTAAEVIVERSDANKPFMGLLTFSKGGLIKKDIKIAKNYLKEKELKKLNNIVSAYFDLAETKAMSREPMKMKDWIIQLDRLIKVFDGNILNSAGSVSSAKALKRAESEYLKYQSKNLSHVEKAYFETIRNVPKKIKKKAKKKSKQKKKL